MTVFDLEVILGQVRMVIDRASMSVQYVFLFTLLAGIIVLLAAIQATRDERRFESALLHTLGTQRRKILQGIAVEFVALGSLAGALAAFGATAVGFVMAEQVFKLDYTIDPWLWLAGCHRQRRRRADRHACDPAGRQRTAGRGSARRLRRPASAGR